MNGKERDRWLLLGAVASVSAAVWVGFLLLEGVTVFGCKYLVPVAHHSGVLTCSDHPRPIHVP